MSKLSDVKTPPVREFQLINGKTARLGTITLGVLVRVENEFGSFEAWQNNLSTSGGGQVQAIASMIWLLCLNKDEVSNPKDSEQTRMFELLDVFPMSNVGDLREFIDAVLAEAMPKIQAQKGAAGGSKKK